MKERINNQREGTGKIRRADGWNELLVREEDYDLFAKLSDYFRGLSDIEEVKKDPEFASTCSSSEKMIEDYTIKPKNRAFILENTDEGIRQIREEIRQNNISEVSSQWVADWEARKKKHGSEKNREFIKTSLGEIENKSEEQPNSGKRVSRKAQFLRYALSAAAVITGFILMVYVFVQSDDPGRLFNKYYEPLSAVSPVTRAGSINGSYRLAEAVTLYNKGEYNAATIVLSEIIASNSSLAPPRFYLGMSHLALGNYSQAADILEEVAAEGGEYIKEARWYLGLIYIKGGDKGKARECFQFLVQPPGYYSERSERILRRLR